MLDDKSGKKLPLMELFGPTFQGEGALCGTQTYFLRFGLCDYKCTFCDSMHAVMPDSVKALASWKTPAEIVADFWLHVAKQDAREPAQWMTLTGGNPCIHDLSQLVGDLQRSGIKVNVETQGTLCPDWVRKCDMVTISPKTPGMGERFEHDKFIAFLDSVAGHAPIAVKVVVFDNVDLEFASMIFDIVDAANNEHLCVAGYEIQKFLSLGNPYPPGHPNLRQLADDREMISLDDAIKLELLGRFRSLCEDILKDNRFRDVVFLPQLHVLTWANMQKV